jgi:hypothetical protein
VHFIHPHPTWHLQCEPVSNGLAGDNKELYKYVQMYTQDKRKGGNHNSEIGDLTVDVSTQPSTYIKTSIIEETFQC